MKNKPFILSCMIAAMVFMTMHAFAQCEIAVPPDSRFICPGYGDESLSNTSNSIVINNPVIVYDPLDPSNPGVLPQGAYMVVISYYDQVTAACGPVISCSNASVTSSGSTMTISMGNCAALPADLSQFPELFINLVSTTGGTNYVLRFYFYSCAYPLGNAAPSQVMTGIHIVDLPASKQQAMGNWQWTTDNKQ